MIFFISGHDTAATGLSWILYCLASNPEYQEKVRHELDDLLGDREQIEM